MPSITPSASQPHLSDVKKTLLDIGIRDHKVILAVVAYDNLAQYGAYVDEYLDAVLEAAGEDATVIMNTFSWKFCETGQYDHIHTPSEVGLASEVFRRMEGVIRSPHPIFSLCGKGPLAGEILRHPGPTCWGDGTPAEYLMQHNALCVSVGKEFPRAITILHSFEEWKKVPYRHYKTFKGTVNFGQGTQEYQTEFFVRKDQRMWYGWEPGVELLRQRNLIRSANKDLPIKAVLAKDLQNAIYEILDKNAYAFVRTE